MSDKEFINGLIAKAPHERAPDFIKCCLSIKREELIRTLQSKSDEWINVDVKVSKAGNWYAEVDHWEKPSQTGSQAVSESFDDDLPF